MDGTNLEEIEILLVYASTQIESTQKQQFLQEILTKLKPMGTKGTSIYDALMAEGEARGLAKGEVKGELKGKSQLLIKQLEAKFPTISPEQKEIVGQLGSGRLEDLAIELFTIESLSELDDWLGSMDKSPNHPDSDFGIAK